MPPNKGDTAFERASRLTNQAYTIQIKAALGVINAKLKERHAAIPIVLREMIRHSFLDPDSKDMQGLRTLYETGAPVAAAGPASASPAVHAGGQAPQLALEDAKADETDEQAAAHTSEGIDDNRPFDKNATSMSDLSVARLETLLQLVEPVTFSKGNLKCILRRGARAQNQTALLQLVELCTNIPIDGEIPLDCRSLKSLGAHCMKLSRALGRRARDLQLPLTPESELIYSMERASASEVKITHNFRQQSFNIMVPTDADLYIHASYSEYRAQLRQRAGPYQQPLSVMFNSLEPVMPSPTLRKRDMALALTDGGGATVSSSTAFATPPLKRAAVAWSPPPPSAASLPGESGQEHRASPHLPQFRNTSIQNSTGTSSLQLSFGASYLPSTPLVRHTWSTLHILSESHAPPQASQHRPQGSLCICHCVAAPLPGGGGEDFCSVGRRRLAHGHGHRCGRGRRVMSISDFGIVARGALTASGGGGGGVSRPRVPMVCDSGVLAGVAGAAVLGRPSVLPRPTWRGSIVVARRWVRKHRSRGAPLSKHGAS